MSYAQKFKILLPKPHQGGSNECPYAILSPYDKKCRRSSQKCEKMSKNHKFFDRRVKTGNHSTVKPMPVCCFYQYASTIAISHWSDFGKVVKCSRWARTSLSVWWVKHATHARPKLFQFGAVRSTYPVCYVSYPVYIFSPIQYVISPVYHVTNNMNIQIYKLHQEITQW